MDRKKVEVLCSMDVLKEDIQMVAMREDYTRERVKKNRQTAEHFYW